MGEETFENVTNNVQSKARKATLNGRNYLVVDGTILKEGVLKGSKGRLYYPKEEVEKNPNSWDGMPLVGYHPIVNGKPVSARTPEILSQYQLGYVYKTKAKDGKVKTQYWFDEELTQNFDQKLDEDIRIIPRLEKAEPIETSTGVFTEDIKANEGANFNGEEYEYIATNYRPDHVAVLPDQIGACSVEQGCGVCVNSSESYVKKIVNYVTNLLSSGKKDVTDNELSHDDIRCQLSMALRSMNTQDMPSCYILDVYDDYIVYEQGMKMYRMDYTKSDTGVTLSGNAVEVVRDVSYRNVTDPMMETNSMALTAEQKKQKVDYLTTNCACWKGAHAVLNNMSDDQITQIEADAKAKAPATPILSPEQIDQLANVLKEKLTPTVPVTPPANQTPPVTPPPATAPVAQPLTANEWLAAAPAEIRAILDDATQVRNNEKSNLVNILTANVKSDAHKQQLTAFFNTKDVSELRILAQAYPQQTSIPRPSYVGAGGAPVINNEEPVDDQPLIAPTLNYDEEVANRVKPGRVRETA